MFVFPSGLSALVALMSCNLLLLQNFFAYDEINLSS